MAVFAIPKISPYIVKQTDIQKIIDSKITLSDRLDISVSAKEFAENTLNKNL